MPNIENEGGRDNNPSLEYMPALYFLPEEGAAWNRGEVRPLAAQDPQVNEIEDEANSNEYHPPEEPGGRISQVTIRDNLDKGRNKVQHHVPWRERPADKGDGVHD